MLSWRKKPSPPVWTRTATPGLACRGQQRLDLRNILCGMFTQAHRWGWWTEHNPAMDATVRRRLPTPKKRNVRDHHIRELFGEVPEDVRMILQLSFTLRITETFGDHE